MGKAKRNKRRQDLSTDEAGEVQPTIEGLADLLVDFWRLENRVREESDRDRVLTACERVGDRIRRLGFEVDSMVGRPYDTSLKARVVDHDESDGPLLISHCVSPAVMYRGKLVREAEIVTTGGEK